MHCPGEVGLLADELEFEEGKGFLGRGALQHEEVWERGARECHLGRLPEALLVRTAERQPVPGVWRASLQLGGLFF